MSQRVRTFLLRGHVLFRVRTFSVVSDFLNITLLTVSTTLHFKFYQSLLFLDFKVHVVFLTVSSPRTGLGPRRYLSEGLRQNLFLSLGPLLSLRSLRVRTQSRSSSGSYRVRLFYCISGSSSPHEPLNLVV